MTQTRTHTATLIRRHIAPALLAICLLWVPSPQSQADAKAKGTETTRTVASYATARDQLHSHLLPAIGHGGRLPAPGNRLLPAPTDRRIKVILDVPCRWNQYKVGLPTGCESLALTSALQYHGFDLKATTIADSYLPLGDDFINESTGNPHENGSAAIMAPGLTATANAYLHDQGSSLRAHEITGTLFEKLYRHLDRGRCIIVWSTIGMTEPGGARQSRDGYTRHGNTHTVVLAGYDREKGTVLVCDSIAGRVWRDAYRFGCLYDKMGKQAIVIE